MRHSSILLVATLAAALVGCGEDGPDGPGAALAAANDGDAAAIQIFAGASDDGHGEAAHDVAGAAMPDEAMRDDAGTVHDDDGEAMHDEADGTHDEAGADGSETDHDGFVVEVEMLEFGFALDSSTVPMGEPVTFRFRNTGVIEHEAMFGSAHQQGEYAAADGHGSDLHHGDVAAITLAAGAIGEMALSFDSPDEIWIGCHIEGHWDAGMQATFEVA